MSKSDILGFKELEKQLATLGKAHARRALARTLKKSAEPLRARAAEQAPRDTGALEDSVIVGTRLNKTQSKQQRRAEGEFAAEAFVGSTSIRAHLLEFGTEHTSPQAFLGPAWDAEKDGLVETIREELWKSTTKAIKRQAKAAAKRQGGE